MSSAQSKPKATLFQIAMPASVVMLTGLILFASLRGDGAETTLPAAPESNAIADNVPSPDDAAHSRLSALAARSGARAPVRSTVTTDPISALSQLRTVRNPADAKLARDRMVAEMENQHQAEPVDAAWSAQSEVNIMSASIAPVVLQAGFKPQNIATDCRSRTCRISANFTTAGDAEDWGDRVITQMGGTLSQVKTTVIQLPDGRSEIRMYGARKQPSRG